MPINESRPRIVFDVSPELQTRINNNLSWGDKRKVFTALTEQLADLLEAYEPDLVIAGIVSKQVKLETLVDFNKGVKEQKE